MPDFRLNAPAKRGAAPAIVVAVGAAAMVAFTVFLPPYAQPSALPLSSMAGDWGLYIYRFALSLGLLGLLPLAATAILRRGHKELGLCFSFSGIKPWAFAAMLAVGAASGVVGGLSPELSAYYPYGKSIAALAASDGAQWFALHAAAYGFLYYLPWEFFFRGFLLLLPLALVGIKPGKVPDDEGQARVYWLIAFAQAIPSALLHFGHPATEMFSAIPAGLAFGWLAIRSGSILPSLVLHALIGFSTDATIIINGGVR